MTLAAELLVTNVHFTGHVSDEELVAFYEIADLFLCASEHEGFCVPLVEAFYKQVPVLAYAATAVPSTMDGARRAVRRPRIPATSPRSWTPSCLTPSLQDAIVEGTERGGRTASGQGFQRDSSWIRRTDSRVAARHRAEGGRRLLAQFDAAQALEELRQVRPALYKALP